MAGANFWQDRLKADEAVRRLGILNDEISRWRAIEDGVETLQKTYDEPKFYELRKQFREFERRELFVGPYDRGSAVLSIYPFQT